MSAIATTSAATEPQALDYMSCPACSSKQLRRNMDQLPPSIKVCRRCNAIFGDCYLGDSYTLVLPLFETVDVPADQVRYYDFTCLGSAGVTRRHGWYNPATRRITQTG